MYSNQNLNNNGIISFEQFFDNKGAAFNIRNPVLSPGASNANVYNNGAIRLINVNYQQVQNVYGSGCWVLGAGSTLYLQDGVGVFQNPTRGPALPGQSISFQDPSASLHLDPAVYRSAPNFGAKLYGFGSGNSIEFYEIIRSFSYSTSSGTLTVVMITGNTVNFDIGLGYNPWLFSNSRHSSKYNFAGYNAIFYRGNAPSRSAPTQCSVSLPICSDLSGGLPSSSPSSTSTSSAPASTSSVASSSTLVSTTSSQTSTTSTTVLPPASSSSTSSSSSSSSTTASSTTTASATTTSMTTASSACTFTTPPVFTSAYTPYYPALATSYTTNPALTATTTAGQACPTTPEAGTYCGFINPLDPCAPQPDGYGPVPSPDTASAFLAFSSLHAQASAAPTIVQSQCNTQYQQVFKDLDGSVSAQSYLGLRSLPSYDVQKCAAYCDGTPLCTSFNVFAERDPSLNPAANDSSAATVWGYWCPTPPTMTTYKCTLWGSNIDASLATNKGQWREQFQVVVTASDGYDRTNATVPNPPNVSVPGQSSTASVASSAVSVTSSAASVTSSTASVTSSAASVTSSTASSQATPSGTAGTKPGSNCNGQAINSFNHWMGTRFFPGPFNPTVCGSYALAQNAANSAASSYFAKVGMINAYYVHKNGVPFGTFCALYDTVLDNSFATNSGGSSGSDSYSVRQSWTWALI